MSTFALGAVAGLLLGSSPGGIELAKVAEGFSQPLAVRSANDGSGRLFVVEQDGVIKILNADGSTRATPFLDLSNNSGSGLTNSSGERGLLGLAFDPSFTNNGYFYVNYTDLASPFNTVVARYTVSATDDNVAEPGSALIILTIPQDFGNHNGGDIHFGPDNYLYVGMGDGGSGGDPLDRGQDLGELLGKMLRIDVDQSKPPTTNACATTANYSIPTDNPFFGAIGVTNICWETWASGLRNPYRFSFDRSNGDLLIGDVGQGRIEEIDLAPAGIGGQNFGWNCREGSTTFASDCIGTGGPYTDPIIEYGHSDGRCSVTGGFRSRGPEPQLSGQYIYGDFCTGEIFAATESIGVWTAADLIDPDTDDTDYCPPRGPGLTPNCLSGFGEDNQGEVLVIDRGGRIYRLVDDGVIFSDGFE